MSEEECTGVNSTVSHTGCFILPSRIEMVRSMKSVLWDRVEFHWSLNWGIHVSLETLPGGRVSGRIGDDPDAGIIDETFVEPEVVREGI
jgi:hypothetical protein